MDCATMDSSWNTMDHRALFMGDHGLLFTTMGYHGLFIDSHGPPSTPMGCPWAAMVYYELPWATMDYHRLP